MRRWGIMFALGLVGVVVVGGVAGAERRGMSSSDARSAVPMGIGTHGSAAVARPSLSAPATPMIPPAAPTPAAAPLGLGTPSPQTPGRVAVVPCSGQELRCTAVWGMLEGFRMRSPEQYVAWMSDDFRFDSDDPELLAAFPNGMTRDDEAKFATHLFRGGATSAQGTPLPVATNVTWLVGSVAIACDADGGVHVVLYQMRVWIALANGDTIHMGPSRNVIVMKQTSDGWRVSAWHERSDTRYHQAVITEPGAPISKTGSAVNHAAEPDAGQHVARAPGLRPISERGAIVLAHLDLAAHPGIRRASVVFDLAMPKPGGTLEIFDVMGRRISTRDLSDLGIGRHQITIDATSWSAGIYFARVRQNDAAMTARIVWAR